MATPIPSNVASFDLAEIARATAGTLVGADVHVRGVVTDTRAVLPGQLFVALRGESFDGHGFVADALGKGAIAAVVADASALPPGASGVVVADTLVALGAIGHAHRVRWGGKVVGITGSAGKTTTKELLRSALEATGASVHATVGNLNNRIGVPMTLLGLSDSHELAVVEMGTSEVGEIAKLAAIAAPDVAIVTSIALSHAAGIGDVEDVAVEKGALFRALAPDGVAVVNMDDPRVVEQATRVARTLTYGTHAGASHRLVACDLDERGARIAIAAGHDSSPIGARLGIPSEVAALNAAGALAVVSALGLDVAQAASGLDIRGAGSRMEPHVLASGALLLDDTYNANPRSMAAAIASASHLAVHRGGSLIVVLGEMRELGSHTDAAHEDVGQLVVDARATRFVGVGDAMKKALAVATRHGIHTAHHAASNDAARDVGPLAAHDVVLVKGSRSMRMERVVRALGVTEIAS